MQSLAARGWQPDYVAIREEAGLRVPQQPVAAGSLIVFGAATLGTTRLIDNVAATLARV